MSFSCKTLKKLIVNFQFNDSPSKMKCDKSNSFPRFNHATIKNEKGKKKRIFVVDSKESRLLDGLRAFWKIYCFLEVIKTEIIT